MAKRSARQRELDESFYMGVLSAMAVVASHDYETVWRDIARSCGGHRLLRRISKKHDNLVVDGFTAYKESR